MSSIESRATCCCRESDFPRELVEPDARSSWQLFVEGDELYRSMLADIAAARSSVRMESYIFADDAIGRRFAEALVAQAHNGCRVHLRVDYAGSRWELGTRLVRELRAAGVRFEWSHRWRWARPWTFHCRNHRKLVIVDDGVAYVGGFNVHEAASRELCGAARWRDTHVRFTGRAVREAIEVFDLCGNAAHRVRPRSGSLWVLPSATRRCRRRLRCELDGALSTARRRIWLTTPYFVPDRRLRRRLAAAAREGVDVRVLVPGKSDVPIAQWAARALYSFLLTRGVRVYEYGSRVLHAKTLVVDDRWATVGTANFDYRSFFANAEVNLVALNDPAFADALARQFRRDLQDACEIDSARWQGRSWRQIAREWFAWPVRKWL